MAHNSWNYQSAMQIEPPNLATLAQRKKLLSPALYSDRSGLEVGYRESRNQGKATQKKLRRAAALSEIRQISSCQSSLTSIDDRIFVSVHRDCPRRIVSLWPSHQRRPD